MSCKYDTTSALAGSSYPEIESDLGMKKVNDIGEQKSIQSVGEGNNQNYRKETTEKKLQKRNYRKETKYTNADIVK